MKFTVPTTLQQEHEALHDELRRATQAGGEIGEAAKILAGLEKQKEGKKRMKMVGRVEVPQEAFVAALLSRERAERLEADLPAMLEEHQAIVVALRRLRDAAERAGRKDIVVFAEQLVQHARTEEEVMYPAAILVGRHVRLLLAQRDEQRSAT